MNLTLSCGAAARHFGRGCGPRPQAMPRAAARPKSRAVRRRFRRPGRHPVGPHRLVCSFRHAAMSVGSHAARRSGRRRCACQAYPGFRRLFGRNGFHSGMRFAWQWRELGVKAGDFTRGEWLAGSRRSGCGSASRPRPTRSRSNSHGRRCSSSTCNATSWSRVDLARRSEMTHRGWRWRWALAGACSRPRDEPDFSSSIPARDTSPIFRMRRLQNRARPPEPEDPGGSSDGRYLDQRRATAAPDSAYEPPVIPPECDQGRRSWRFIAQHPPKLCAGQSPCCRSECCHPWPDSC
jgi:hypothetical protein